VVNKMSPILFQRKCDVDPVTGCWNWKMSVQSAGYGQVKISGQSWTTHRASWTVHRGPIPFGLDVLHTCDNTRCCNPEHLFLGDQLDNYRDAVAKNRPIGFPRGAQRKNRVRKLTNADVERIRTSNETAAELAAALGVARCSIYQIRNGKRKMLV
jgi:hypothetical protein